MVTVIRNTYITYRNNSLNVIVTLFVTHANNVLSYYMKSYNIRYARDENVNIIAIFNNFQSTSYRY